MKRPEIGPFAQEEAQAVSALIGRALREINIRDYSPEHVEWLACYYSPERVRALARGGMLLTARDAGQTVGCGALVPHAAGQYSLCAFFVRPDYRGTGLGRRMLEALEALAAARGARRVVLDASLTACGFYERQGYRYRGGEKRLKNHDVYEMEKEL